MHAAKGSYQIFFPYQCLSAHHELQLCLLLTVRFKNNRQNSFFLAACSLVLFQSSTKDCRLMVGPTSWFCMEVHSFASQDSGFFANF